MSRRWLIAISVVAHLALGVGLFVSGVWRIERVHAAPVHTVLTVPLSLPAPSGSLVSAVEVKIEPRRRPTIVKDTVQPVTRPVDPTPPTSDGQASGAGNGSGDPDKPGTCIEGCGEARAAAPVCGDGAVDASEQCDDGNTFDGDGCSASCRIEAPPPPRPPATAMVAPTVLQGLRISGETQLHPSQPTQSLMIRDGIPRVSGTVQVCLATDGSVASATMARSTKYDDYDQVLLAGIRAWRYRPYTFNGAPVPACSYVTFNYTIQ